MYYPCTLQLMHAVPVAIPNWAIYSLWGRTDDELTETIHHCHLLEAVDYSFTHS